LYLRENIAKYKEYIEQMKEKGQNQISFVDPDSRLMKVSNGGFKVSYSRAVSE
jgi:maltodextrin utilization protein YvdJ